MSAPLRIGIAGLGTVGAGVVKILQDNEALVTARAGRPIEIIAVCARAPDKDRGIDCSAYEWIAEPQALAADPRIDVVVELIGGEEGPALALVRAALENGKAVVSANKALMAHYGYELALLAEENGVPLRYEAAVAGGIPVIKMLREGLAANHISAVYGILNGTCNYILSEMRETGRDFSEVLAEAQALGYAEADPSFDIGGIDAAHKLCLLSALSFGIRPDLDHVQITGIAHITAQDIAHAGALGYRIKLLGIARRSSGGQIIQSVEPCLVPADSMLGAVEGVFNAVYVDGDFVDTGLAVGRGAGAGPTASAVVADLIDLARGSKAPVFGVPASVLETASIADVKAEMSRFYMHLVVRDRPGVLADIATLLRDHQVSIESVMQRGHDPDNPVSIVLMTHNARQGAIRAVRDALSAFDNTLGEPCLLRVEDF